MEKKVLELLQQKFSGVADTVLAGVADKLAKTASDEAAAKAAVDAYTVADLLESYADKRAQAASVSAVRNYEKKYNLAHGKPVEAPGAPDTDEPSKQGAPAPSADPAIAELLKKQGELIEALQGKISGMEQGALRAERTAKVKAAIGALPEAMQKAYSRIDVASLSEEAFTATLAEITTEAADMAKQMGKARAVFGAPAQGKKTASDELTDEQLKAITERAGSVKAGDEAQPF